MSRVEVYLERVIHTVQTCHFMPTRIRDKWTNEIEHARIELVMQAASVGHVVGGEREGKTKQDQGKKKQCM